MSEENNEDGGIECLVWKTEYLLAVWNTAQKC